MSGFIKKNGFLFVCTALIKDLSSAKNQEAIFILLELKKSVYQVPVADFLVQSEGKVVAVSSGITYLVGNPDFNRPLN